MSLQAGTRLGPYEIVGPLGAGGLGEVYRARDARLGRDVAVKALPAQAALDPDRLARFAREAQVLAALNHPHIAAIYGLEEVGAAQFLILELVEGGTLADRLSRGAMPLADVLAVARQIADGLQAAHDKGIVHRDLKPGNIALTRAGQAKILDFGLAKSPLASPDAATSPAPATESGVIMGTAGYMSPEQARGLPLDKRTDVWSFGCICFEALSGAHPFAGPTASDTIAAILGREPDFTRLPADTPARIVWLLRRCLAKDPRTRLHDIADARIELEEAVARPHESGALAQASVRAVSPWRERAAWAVAALAILAAIGVYLRRSEAPGPAVGPAFHVAVVLPREIRISAAEDPSSRLALSPDGRRLVVVAGEPSGEARLWLRPLDGVGIQPLAGTEGATCPFWSPDSQSIGFIARPAGEGITTRNFKLKRVDLPSGQVSTIADLSFASTAAWGKDDVILFTPTGTSPIHRVSASGGPVAPVTSLDAAAGDVQHTNPFFLPDGRHFLYSALGSRAGGATDARAVYVGSLDAKDAPTEVLTRGTNAKYASGHVIFVRGGKLMALPFDAALRRVAPNATPMTLSEGVQDTGGSGGGSAAAFSASDSGVIAYQPVVPIPMQLEWLDRSGARVAALGDVADNAEVVLSPDGLRAAVSVLNPVNGARDITVYDVTRGVRDRITSGPADDFAPVWAPTGDRLIFSSVREGRVDLFQTTGSLDGEQLLPVPGLAIGKFAASWSPDAAFLAFVAGARVIARSDIWVRPIPHADKAYALLESASVETQPRFSPDGKWLLYSSNESGRMEVAVRPFPGPGPKFQVSVGGGSWGLWRKDQSEIFFLDRSNNVMAAAITIDAAGLRVGAIRRLFPIRFRQVRLDAYPYAVRPDGQQFLVNTLLDEAASSTISLLVNWPAALRR